MKYIQAGKSKLVRMGAWLAEDPRRLTFMLTLIITMVTVLALTSGLAQMGTLVGPNSEGTSGGG